MARAARCGRIWSSGRRCSSAVRDRGRWRWNIRGGTGRRAWTGSPGPGVLRRLRPTRAFGRRRAYPPSAAPVWAADAERTRMVPTFTIIRSTGPAPGYTPAASPRLRRRPSPWPPDPAHRARAVRRSATDVTSSRLLPASPATPGSGCPQLPPAATTAKRWTVSYLHPDTSASWRTHRCRTPADSRVRRSTLYPNISGVG